MSEGAQHDHGAGLRAMAAGATLHCLTGCAIGEILGLVLGTALDLPTAGTLALSVALAFVFGYTLSTLPLLRTGMDLASALRLVLAADTLSILTMEVVDNLVMAVVPGAMGAGLVDVTFWLSMTLSLAVAFAAAYPVNQHLLSRGRGHALTHERPHSSGRPVGVRRFVPSIGTPLLVGVIGAFILGGVVVSTAEHATDDAGGAVSMSSVAGRGSANRHDEADVRFAANMVPHHRQALAMARLADSRAVSATVRRLAARIEAAQQPEIDTMSGWLEDWDARAADAPMAGMMSSDDMGSLADLSGRRFDRAFLTMMAEHHRGAVAMADQELARGRNAPALGLAASILVTQRAELRQMHALRASA